MALTWRAPLLLPLLAVLLLLAGCRSGHAARPISPPPTGAVAVGRSVTDPVTGDVLTVQDVDRDGGKLLVEVTAAAGSRFATGIPPTALAVRTAAGTVVAASAAPAPFTPYVGAEPGRRAGGWLAFATPPAAGSSLLLSRAAFTVVGSQQTEPAASYPVALPAV